MKCVCVCVCVCVRERERERTQCHLAFLRALMVFDSQLLQCVFSSVNRLFLRRLVNSSGKIMTLLCKTRRPVWGGGRLDMWVDNQQVQSMFQVIFMAAEFDRATVSCLWWWHTLADCPEMAQTGVAVKYLVAVCKTFLRACFPFARMLHQLVCVMAQGRQWLVNATTLN